MPTATRPTPVILVHGTIGDRRHLLEPLGKALKAAGFCVYAPDYGNRALEDVVASAQQLADFVEKVRESTGADKVSMVGHSQGGMMPRYYIKFLGGAPYVDDLVGIAPSNHGSRIAPSNNPLRAVLPGLVCVSCDQQAWGSEFLKNLNAGDETPGDVSYTQITTRFDEVVVPHTSGYLTPGPNTTNITLQDKCPRAIVDHILVPTARGTIGITLDALTHDGPASPTVQPPC